MNWRGALSETADHENHKLMTELEKQSKLLGETPRVDAAEFIVADADKPPGPTARWRVVDANFARQLERENAELRKSLRWITERLARKGKGAVTDAIDQALSAIKPHLT